MVLFKGLSEANLQAMIKRMKVKSFKDGDTIVEQGTIGTTMYFIDLGGARAIVGDTVAQTLASGMQLFVCVFACAGGVSRPAHGESSKMVTIHLSSRLLANLSKGFYDLFDVHGEILDVKGTCSVSMGYRTRAINIKNGGGDICGILGNDFYVHLVAHSSQATFSGRLRLPPLATRYLRAPRTKEKVLTV